MVHFDFVFSDCHSMETAHSEPEEHFIILGANGQSRKSHLQSWSDERKRDFPSCIRHNAAEQTGSTRKECSQGCSAIFSTDLFPAHTVSISLARPSGIKSHCCQLLDIDLTRMHQDDLTCLSVSQLTQVPVAMISISSPVVRHNRPTCF